MNGSTKFAVPIWTAVAPAMMNSSASVADAMPPSEGWPSLSMLGGAGSNLVFLDLETTGLAGGAGTYAFLVGCAWFDGGVFRIRQLFLSSFGAEKVLLEALRDELGLTYLFIAHDLGMVRHISTRVAVMYLGKMMELTASEELYENPLHPYTKALLSAIPIPDPVLERARRRILLEGDLPSPANPPAGCRFSTRCPLAIARCRRASRSCRRS